MSATSSAAGSSDEDGGPAFRLDSDEDRPAQSPLSTGLTSTSSSSSSSSSSRPRAHVRRLGPAGVGSAPASARPSSTESARSGTPSSPRSPGSAESARSSPPASPTSASFLSRVGAPVSAGTTSLPGPPRRSRQRPDRPALDWQQRAVRFASLCLFPAAVVVPASTAMILHRLALTPLYNSTPLASHSQPLYAALAVLSAIHMLVRTRLFRRSDDGRPSAARRLDARACIDLCALWTDAGALLARRIGSATGLLGPAWGAAAARAVLGAGVVAGSTAFAVVCALSTTPSTRASTIAAVSATYVAAIWATERVLEPLVRASPLALAPENGMLAVSFIFTLLGLCLRSAPCAPGPLAARLPPALRGRLSALPALTALRLPLVAALVAAALSRPATPYLAAGGALRVLSSEAGPTGRVVVGEHVGSGFRFLRVDAGLVGGYWLWQRRGVELGDSIFATFPLQEIGVLVDRGDPDEGAVTTVEIETGLRLGSGAAEGPAANAQDKQERALIIGLGVGVTASAFARRGMAVDVVELDPRVYDAAVAYFGLAQAAPRAVHITDGAAFVAGRAEAARNGSAADGERYSYVVQDCYTGGQVPFGVFTREFWDDVKAVLDPGGVVVMNFAGLISSRSARQALWTLTGAFAQCRAFGDGLERHLAAHDLANLVVVCVDTLDPLLAFRPPTPADVLRSPLRAHVFSTLHANEVDLDALVWPGGQGGQDGQDGQDREAEAEREGLLIRRGHETEGWGTEGAAASWRAMRHVMTPAMWRVW